jgi:hypothetical protein
MKTKATGSQQRDLSNTEVYAKNKRNKIVMSMIGFVLSSQNRSCSGGAEV